MNGIYKTSNDFIAQIDLNRPPDLYAPMSVTNPLTGEPITVFNLRPGAPASSLLYTNPDRADRRYRAFEWVLSQRPWHGVQLLFSHVWSRSTGLATQGQ